MNRPSMTTVNPPKKIIYRSYVTPSEWENGCLKEDAKANPRELTKEFRVKPTILCEGNQKEKDWLIILLFI